MADRNQPSRKSRSRSARRAAAVETTEESSRARPPESRSGQRAQRQSREESDPLRDRLRAQRERRMKRINEEEVANKKPRSRAARRSPGDSGPQPERIAVRFDESLIDEGALKVVSRLTRAGYEAYLVGGCVRDLLVGARPKDFDVATSARPEQVRSLFRNSRIIGRRFRLVHVLFGESDVIETATFRRNPPESKVDDDHPLIVSDNYFGRAYEDAFRRDFTINALFYDHEAGVVLDWVGGMEHIRHNVVQTIGEPTQRFLEDPIRILRAIKFASRLNFGIAPEVYEAAVSCRGSLAMAARPRVSEEILRLMRGGAGARAIWLLFEMGLLDILLPELSSYLQDCEDDQFFWDRLLLLDEWTRAQGGPPDDLILWLALLSDPLEELAESADNRAAAVENTLEPVIERLALTRRQADGIRRIMVTLPKLKGGKAKRFARSSIYPVAMDFLLLSSNQLELDREPARWVEDKPVRKRGSRGRRRER